MNASDGFFFALHLIDSLGVIYDRLEVFRRLKMVSKGEISLFNSPQEELQKLESEAGRRATDAERAEFIRSFDHRGDMEINFRKTAAEIVGVLDSDGVQWPS